MIENLRKFCHIVLDEQFKQKSKKFTYIVFSLADLPFSSISIWSYFHVPFVRFKGEKKHGYVRCSNFLLFLRVWRFEGNNTLFTKIPSFHVHAPYCFFSYNLLWDSWERIVYIEFIIKERSKKLILLYLWS